MSDRRRGTSFERQSRALVLLAALWAAGGAALVIANAQTRIPLRELLLDPTALRNVPWYSGIVSNLGILVWTVAAASALGGAWVARETNRPSASRFLGTGGIVTVILLLDDLLLLHSTVLPRLFDIQKPAATLLVVSPAVAWLLVFAGEVRRTRWVILVGALVSFAVSLAADFVLHPAASAELLLEDGAKFLGVLAWGLYFVLTTYDIVRSTIQTAMAATGDVAAPQDRSVSQQLVN